jgi:hypothetical protein
MGQLRLKDLASSRSAIETSVTQEYPSATIQDLWHAAIIPGLINAHTHLELTAMRGYLEDEESDFFAWLRKLTIARLERMTPEDIRVSATVGCMRSRTSRDYFRWRCQRFGVDEYAGVERCGPCAELFFRNRLDRIRVLQLTTSNH